MKPNKKVVRVTKSKLKSMIAESVSRVLKEGVNNGLHEDLSEIIQRHEELANSSYIPFGSPSLSPTEAVVKQSVIQALELLDNADSAAWQLHY